ncbi:MAG: ThuA domain-containing protein [Puniceicoccaceae bacterium]
MFRSSKIFLIFPFLLVAADAEPIDVLIIDGYSNHNWRLNTELIKDIIEPTGLFNVDVSTAPETAEAPGWDKWRPNFKAYDVVIQTCNNLGGRPDWPEEVKSAFVEYVRDGGGVYIWHAGNNSFASWPEYNDIIGLGWRKADFGWAITIDENEKVIRIPAGEGEKTGHGPRHDTVVHRLGDHPIHRGMPRSWMTPDIEVYYFARGPAKNLQVLSYGINPKNNMNWPLEWTVRYGEGRVYNSSFGHVWKTDGGMPDRMRCAGLQTIVIRTLEWLAGREVSWPVPDNFPTESAVSLVP